jgi:hypothetical protein
LKLVLNRFFCGKTLCKNSKNRILFSPTTTTVFDFLSEAVTDQKTFRQKNYNSVQKKPTPHVKKLHTYYAKILDAEKIFGLSGQGGGSILKTSKNLREGKKIRIKPISW